MLSKVAERTYWIGRYIERAENTARLISVNSNLYMDTPKSVNQTWRNLIDIIDCDEPFHLKYESTDEKNVLSFMLRDNENSSSLISTLKMLRENARTTREILPSESWEEINELNLFAREFVNQALVRSGRHEFLDSIIKQCHQLCGLLDATLSNDHTYNFIKIGMYLERMDMTSRILDVGSTHLFSGSDEIQNTYENILWMSILRSLGAYQMYHQHVMERINGKDVVNFLINDKQFPRSVAHCLNHIEKNLQELPRSQAPVRTSAHIIRMIDSLSIEKIIDNKLHEFIDELQIEFINLHNEINNAWFRIIDD